MQVTFNTCSRTSMMLAIFMTYLFHIHFNANSEFYHVLTYLENASDFFVRMPLISIMYVLNTQLNGASDLNNLLIIIYTHLNYTSEVLNVLTHLNEISDFHYVLIHYNDFIFLHTVFISDLF